MWTALVIASAVFLYIGLPLIYRIYACWILKSTAVKSNALVLTFDDGPSDRLTPMIMDLLDQYDAKATFFLLGRNISGREKIIKQIQKRGHEICSHGYDHLNYWKVSPFHALADIKRGWQTINNALELRKKVYPFRPPYGKLNIICLLYLLARRTPIIYWTKDSGDSSKKMNNYKIELLAANAQGTVVLAHDFKRSDEKSEHLILESILFALKRAKENGMRIMTVSELLNNRK